MPLYEYYCPNCKSKFEMLVSHQHADDIVCMKCRSEKVHRLLSVFASPRGAGESANYRRDAHPHGQLRLRRR